MPEEEQPELLTATFALGPFRGAQVAFEYGWPRGTTRVGYMEVAASGTANDADATELVEAIEVAYDPQTVSYSMVLWRFWAGHDATAANTPAYAKSHTRSIIFFHSPDQKAEAQAHLERWRSWSRGAVTTEILPATTFQPADADQQDFYQRHGLTDWWPIYGGPQLSSPVPNDAEYQEALPRLARLVDLLGPNFGVPAKSEIPLAGDVSNPAVNDQHALVTMLSVALLHDQALIDAAVDHIRRWSSSESDLADRIRRSVVAPDVVAEHACLHLATTSSELTIAGTLRRGGGRILGQRRHRQRAVQWTPAGTGTAGNLRRPTQELDERHGGLAWYGPPTDERLELGWAPQPDATASTTGQWFEHLPPTEFAVECPTNGKGHIARWARGELMFDHLRDDNLTAEKTLQALGGSYCGCWLIRELWPPHWIQQRWQLGRAPSVVSLDKNLGADYMEIGGQGPTAYWPHQVWERRHIARGSQPELPPMDLAEPDSDARITVRTRVMVHITRLSLPLHVRWLLGAMAWLEERHQTLDDADLTTLRVLFFDIVRPAVLQTLWQPLRFDENTSTAAFEVRYLERGEHPAATAEIDPGTNLIHVTVAVPFRWITHVWARGLANIDDHLLLDVRGPADAHQLDVTAVGWHDLQPGQPPTLHTRNTTIHWDGSHWHLA